MRLGVALIEIVSLFVARLTRTGSSMLGPLGKATPWSPHGQRGLGSGGTQVRFDPVAVRWQSNRSFSRDGRACSCSASTQWDERPERTLGPLASPHDADCSESDR